MIEFFTQYSQHLVMPIFLLVVLGLIIEGAIAEKYTSEILIWTPRIFYDDMKMNWFGSWFCFILSIIANPCGTILKLSVGITVLLCYVAEFIKWLFTVGRKDD